MRKQSHLQAFEYGTQTIASVAPSEEMIEEIAQILQKHQALNRFGLTQITDSHQPGIVMSETSDPKKRHLLTTPMPAQHINPDTNLETQWRFDVPGMLKACKNTCENSPDGHRPIVHKLNDQ